MTDTQLLANRDTDKLVAEALGWRNVRKPEQNGPVDLVGFPPGAEKELPVPYYSSSTAALLALEDWQRQHDTEVEIRPNFYVEGETDAERWQAANVDTGGFFYAPTLWLAIARMIVASEPSGQLTERI